MKKGTFTRWKKPIAALLGMALVLGTVFGAGSMLPAGVKDALPEAVRETLEPVTAQAAGNDQSMSMYADVLKTDVNKDNAATVYYASKTSSSPWRVIGYGGTGVASTPDTMTLFSANNLATSQFNPDTAGDCNDYATHPTASNQASVLKQTVDGLFDTLFTQAEQNAVTQRELLVDEYKSTRPYSNGVSDRGKSANEVSTTAYLWPLSTAEADALPSDTFRAANNYWWLRSPGFFDYFRGVRSLSAASSITSAITWTISTAFVPLLMSICNL